jgi:hypothetical protein
MQRKKARNNKKPKSDLNQTGGLSPLMAPVKRSFMPDQFRTELKFTTTRTLNLTVPGTGLVYFNPSGAFDVDPVIGSPTMAGYDQFASFYNQYRVLASRIRIIYTNNSIVNPVNFFLLPTGLVPSGFGPVEILSMRGNPYCKWTTSSLLGSPPMFLKNSMTTERIQGTKAALWSDNTSALVSANPVNSWFWAIGYESPVSNSVNSFLQIEIDVDLIFFDKKFVNRV